VADRIEQLRRMLYSEPEDAFCLYALGQEYARRGEFEAAQAHLARSLESDPDQPYAYFHRAKCLQQLGRPGEVQQAIAEGLETAQRTGDAHAADELTELHRMMGGHD